ncbi:MAG: asparagine synthase (glutamine-hydrolyzing) [Deltaproteobacteria bacterium]|nr:asparagine synthase (glutamine-hydrolyzing) [Deltaproteobacteria bacterium]
MCGISGQFNLKLQPVPNLDRRLARMNAALAHRGPDGEGVWQHPKGFLGFGHRRLSIIDLQGGTQPMSDGNGLTVCYNGEIYNYRDLRDELEAEYEFKTTSDTEVILAGYRKWGQGVLQKLRGMFAFALWDESSKILFCARDRFGIKPFYYSNQAGQFNFASEVKALLPFLPQIKTDDDGLREYFTFQFCLGEKTLFEGVEQLSAGHSLTIKNGNVTTERYWEPHYDHDWNHTKRYFQDKLRELVNDSVRYHLVSDVSVGCYLSGGIDSGLVALLASKERGHGSGTGNGSDFHAFTGKFAYGPDYDESARARVVAQAANLKLHEITIDSKDFIENIGKVMYHLDFPVAGPGSFPQFLVSKRASENVKVCLGGQGGDEIFGGYVRYLLAYFELCIKGAIDDTMHSGNFIVTYESIIPNLKSLQKYKPLMKEFWKSGLFEDRDRRYFRLVSRAEAIRPLINAVYSDIEPVFAKFKEIFNGKNVERASYFDSMTNFDFKTLLPALLQVEDRVSMAHGLESRVPLIDHPLIEFAATVPSNVKFEGGELKLLLKETFSDVIPPEVLKNKDKMGFPVPLSEWIKGDLFEFICDTFKSSRAKQRSYLKEGFEIESLVSREGKFDRNLWGLLSLELWQQQYHDQPERFSFE